AFAILLSPPAAAVPMVGPRRFFVPDRLRRACYLGRRFPAVGPTHLHRSQPHTAPPAPTIQPRPAPEGAAIAMAAILPRRGGGARVPGPRRGVPPFSAAGRVSAWG